MIPKRSLGIKEKILLLYGMMFKKEGHQINEVTVEAIYRVIGEEGLRNFYIGDVNKCEIYVPDKYRHIFEDLCDFDRNTLYSCQCFMTVHKR